MSRIRSVHPGLFSDEAFVSLSMSARLLQIGIWTEADDKGVFEWKPLTLKMKVFPADTFSKEDMEAMLAELQMANTVKRFESDGRLYGAIRNFRKHQRPQRPNDVHPLPDELRKFVFLETKIPEPVHEHSVNGSGKSIQMDDGGWKREDEGGNYNLNNQGKTSVGSNTREDFIDADGVIHDLEEASS